MGDWTRKSIGGLDCFRLPVGPGLLVAVTGRRGGTSAPPRDSLNLSYYVGDDPARVAENRERVQASLDLDRLATVRQVHGTAIHEPGTETPGPDPVRADALVTRARRVGLGIKVADCLPVFAWSPDLAWVGVAHCGWRGTVARLALLLARDVARRAGTTPDRLRYALGPCICPDCYTVGQDVIAAVRRSFSEPRRLLRTARGAPGCGFDLRGANRQLLREAGLEETGSLERCTFEESPFFFSARRNRETGRNLAVIALR